jgi:WXG100 family type VII secretion target
MRFPGGVVGGFDATPMELQACGSMLSQISDEVRTRVGSLQTDVDGLLDEWQGAAAAGFAQGWSQWLQGAHDILDGLRDMGAALGDVGANYQTSDVDSADGVRNAGAGL